MQEKNEWMWGKTKSVLANEISFQIERMQDSWYRIQDDFGSIEEVDGLQNCVAIVRGSLLDFGKEEFLSKLERMKDSRYMIQENFGLEIIKKFKRNDATIWQRPLREFR